MNQIFKKMLGRREELVMGVINYIDNLRRNIQYKLHYLFCRDLRSQMSKNKLLKNIHEDKRCFIIGNGPSLKEYDLSKISNEYVFTVNYMMKSEYFKTLNPNYHFLIDPAIFKLNSKNPIENTTIKDIRNTIKDFPNIDFFIPYKRMKEGRALLKGANRHYIYINQVYTSRLTKSYLLNKNTPSFQNVILYAINTAMYMGFKEIYLLGVDMTGFLEYYEYNKKNDEWGHVYETSKEEFEKLKKDIKELNMDNEFYLKAYGKTLEHFKYIKKAAKLKNTKLMNASSHGALDVLQRVDFDKITPNEVH